MKQIIGLLVLAACLAFGSYSYGHSTGYAEGYALGLRVADAEVKACREECVKSISEARDFCIERIERER